VQQLQPLRPQLRAQIAHSREIAARSVQACYETLPHRIGRNREDDWNRAGRRLCGPRRSVGIRGNHGHRTTNQIERHSRQSVVLAFREAIFDCHVTALAIAGVAEALAKRAQILRLLVRRSSAEVPDRRQRRLLRAR
jgi:hypothetical protein